MGSKAEYVRRFTKGQRVLVIGRLEISEWQTHEGETRTSYDIWADDVVNLSPREDGGAARPGGGYASAPAQTAGVGTAAVHSDEATDLDELPVLTACCICL